MPEIGRLEKYPLKSVWEHEAAGFTPWLSKNIEYISELLGFELTVDEVEKQVGRFNADIVAEDPSRGIVVIENQYDQSNHDHLGKILTYIANLGAKIGIWICEKPSQEHINVIEWLNEVSPKDVQFYLIKVETVKIGESSPAPLFTILSKPNESKEIGEFKDKIADRHVKRLKFWDQFIKKCSDKLPLYANRKATKDNWIYTSSGVSGLGYSIVILKPSSRIELYIDRGNQKENKEIFDYFYKNKEEIEKKFGNKLDWQRMDDKRASRIAYHLRKHGLNHEEHWDKIQDNLITYMKKFHEIIDLYIKSINNNLS